MTEFLGKEYTREEWIKAFPLYRYYWPLVLAGAKTPTEIETISRQRKMHARQKLMAGSNRMRDGIHSSAKASSKTKRKTK